MMKTFRPMLEALESRYAPSGTQEPPDDPCDAHDCCVVCCPEEENSPPVCEDVVFNLDVDEPIVDHQLAAVDPDDGAPVSWSVTVDALHGTASISPTGVLNYTPDAGYVGPDTITYHVNDGKSFSEDCVITINITGEPPPPDNLPPTCEDSLGLSTPVDTPLLGGLVGSDPDGDPITFVADTQPANGTLLLDPNTGLFTYTPNLGFTGLDSFTFHTNDGQLDSEVCTVEIAVPQTEPPPGSAPECEDQSICINEDAQDTAGQLTATDADGDPLAFSLGTDGANGTATVDSAGAWTYVPDLDFNGQDSFTAIVDDGTGLTDECTVYLSVTPVNDQPTFLVLGDQSVGVDAGPQSVPLFADPIVLGPADEAGQTGAFTLTTDNDALFATLPAIAPDGTLTYEGAVGASGEAIVTASLKDDGGTGFGGIDTSIDVTFKITIA